MMNRFDAIAPYYDRLSKMAFGSFLMKMQREWLSVISQEDEVLILGGGTGEILTYLPLCKSITFLEKSSAMLDRVQTRAHNLNEIHIVLSDFLLYQDTKKYDVIICPFFLDCFSEKNLFLAIKKIKNLLSKNGKLLVIDFKHNYRYWWLLYMMILFFKVTARLESNGQKDIRKMLKGFAFDENHIKHQKMVFSGVYQLS